MSIPGLLADAVETRQRELLYPSFGPYAIDLIAFDLRTRAEHWITAGFAREPQNVQDAIDRETIRHYTPGAKERKGALVRAIVRKVRSGEFRNIEPTGKSVAVRRITMPQLLHPLLEIRRTELGYQCLSEYVTALIRYDLMLGGPHKYFNGTVTDPDYLRKLDEWTYRTFYSTNKKQKIYLHRLMEQKACRELSIEEARKAAGEIVRKLKRRAIWNRPGE